MSFLPDNYEAPKSNSSYMKLEDGENKIRILTAPIVGWEDWKDKKPVRFRMNMKPEKSIDPEKPLRHFWCLIVWNYGVQKIQVYEVTQASIRKRIETLSKDKDWGSPYGYDLKITKTGQQKNTEYEVNPCPSKELDDRIKEEFMKLPIDLEEMFRGGDPFSATETYRTKAFWEIERHSVPVMADPVISKKQELDIEAMILKEITPKFPHWRGDALKALKIESFSQLQVKFLDLVMKRIREKIDQILGDDCPF
jgi:hypothetical protein